MGLPEFIVVLVARARKFRGVRGYLHSEAPSSGHSETLGEHGFEDDDEDEDDYGGSPL
jgi:hypothetical protein